MIYREYFTSATLALWSDRATKGGFSYGKIKYAAVILIENLCYSICCAVKFVPRWKNHFVDYGKFVSLHRECLSDLSTVPPTQRF